MHVSIQRISKVTISYLCQTYVTEVSDTRWRTTLNAGIGVSALIGMLFTYILGAIFDWRTIIFVSCIFPAASYLIAFFIVPESPPWLVSKGKVMFNRN